MKITEGNRAFIRAELEARERVIEAALEYVEAHRLQEHDCDYAQELSAATDNLLDHWAKLTLAAEADRLAAGGEITTEGLA